MLIHDDLLLTLVRESVCFFLRDHSYVVLYDDTLVHFSLWLFFFCASLVEVMITFSLWILALVVV